MVLLTFFLGIGTISARYYKLLYYNYKPLSDGSTTSFFLGIGTISSVSSSHRRGDAASCLQAVAGVVGQQLPPEMIPKAGLYSAISKGIGGSPTHMDRATEDASSIHEGKAQELTSTRPFPGTKAARRASNHARRPGLSFCSAFFFPFFQGRESEAPQSTGHCCVCVCV